MASGTVTLTGYLLAGNYLITPDARNTKNIPIYNSVSVPENVVIKTAKIELQLRNPGWNTITFKANNSTAIGTMGVGGTGGTRTSSLNKTYNYRNLNSLTLTADNTDRTELVGKLEDTIIITLG